MHYLLWQLADSGFPSGGFTHSNGLEAAIQHGRVESPASLERFIQQTIVHTARASLPFVTGGHRQPETLPDLDRLADVFFNNPVVNRASRAQGRAFLSAIVKSFPGPAVDEIERQVRQLGLCGHYTPVFGALLRTLGVELRDVQRLFLFLAVKGVGAAAVRLGSAGPYDAQQLLAASAISIEQTIDRLGALTPDEAAQTAPLIDFYQSTHDRLYSRMFQS